LTFDAILHKLLCDAGLVPFEVKLRFGEQAWRYIYGSRLFIYWINHTLPTLIAESKSRGSPASQTDARLTAFCDGEQLAYGSQIKPLDPLKDDVWELKTADIRLIGWFPVKNHLVLDVGENSLWLHQDLKRYDRIVEDVVEFRRLLTSFIPGPVKGKRLSDVVSNRSR